MIVGSIIFINADASVVINSKQLIKGLEQYKLTKLRPSENADKIQNIDQFIAYLNMKSEK